jgi:hypothetical protein
MNKTFYSEAKLKEFFGDDYAKLPAEEFIKKASDVKVETPLLVSVRSGAA